MKNKRLLTGILAGVILIAAIAAAAVLNGRGNKAIVNDGSDQLYIGNSEVFSAKTSALKDAVLSGEAEKSANYKTGRYGYIVFISICDSTERAAVFHSNGKSPEIAWDCAVSKAHEFIDANGYEALWVKADIVTDIREIGIFKYLWALTKIQNGFFREGAAFDRGFSCAFLEAELNGAGLINYEESRMDRENIRSYLAGRGEEGLFAGIPLKLILFKTQGFMCGENGEIFRLGTDSGNYGLRIPAEPDDAFIKGLMAGSAGFLSGIIGDDGQFIYGFSPVAGEILPGYNILRQAGTSWALSNQYAGTGAASLIPPIEKAIGFLVDENIECPEPDIAYLIDRQSDEVKIGGNGLAILALVSYAEAFQTDRYNTVIEQLANGIIALQDGETGSFYHILSYPDFSRKKDFSVSFYDGEAAFALARAYGLSGREEYIDSAKKALGYFIETVEPKDSDHWLAYTVSEITKHCPEPQFLEFGLKIAQANVKKIANYKSYSHTSMEMLMALFELYSRTVKDYSGLEYLAEFDAGFFIDTIFKRAGYMLNAYFFPEAAMYMKEPSVILNSFGIRNDGFRVRIDDVQHFMGGYHSYIKNYAELTEARERLSTR